MPILLCPRCQRTNPAEASYCFHDGTDLRGGAGRNGGGALAREFIFPGGRRCRTYDEFAGACSENWQAARELLRQGGMRHFFAGIGRMDLALLADKSAAQPDPDVALDEFIGKLPTRDAPAPQLDLMPRRLNLGKLRIGERRQCQLRIINQGGRLLHGSVSVEDDGWIRLGDGSSNAVAIKTGREQLLTVSVDTVGLVAGQKYASKLTLLTNGGVVEVPVSLEVTPIPFSLPPLQGASSPRELAARMRDFPKQVPPLLESGAVQRWFQSNGWSYPVSGAAAPGVAGVQQFFEGLGLSKPPKLEISDAEVLMLSRTGRAVAGHVAVRTPAKKWVYARVESDVPWLRVLNPDVGGAQEARISFEAWGKNLEGGRRYLGHLQIVANGGQRFQVKVWNEVQTPTVSPASRFLTGLAAGAAAGILYRLILCLVAAVALLVGWGLRGGTAQDWETLTALASGAWLKRSEPGFTLFVRYFSLTCAFAGLAAGAIWLPARGALRDVLAGAIVAGATFLASGATLAVFMDLLDVLLGWVIPLSLPGAAVAGWALWGAVLGGVLTLAGKPGRAVVQRMCWPLLWLADRFGYGEILSERLN